jgi:hypothetical protein
MRRRISSLVAITVVSLPVVAIGLLEMHATPAVADVPGARPTMHGAVVGADALSSATVDVGHADVHHGGHDRALCVGILVSAIALLAAASACCVLRRGARSGRSIRDFARGSRTRSPPMSRRLSLMGCSLR